MQTTVFTLSQPALVASLFRRVCFDLGRYGLYLFQHALLWQGGPAMARTFRFCNLWLQGFALIRTKKANITTSAASSGWMYPNLRSLIEDFTPAMQLNSPADSVVGTLMTFTSEQNDGSRLQKTWPLPSVCTFLQNKKAQRSLHCCIFWMRCLQVSWSRTVTCGIFSPTGQMLLLTWSPRVYEACIPGPPWRPWRHQ